MQRKLICMLFLMFCISLEAKPLNEEKILDILQLTYKKSSDCFFAEKEIVRDLLDTDVVPYHLTVKNIAPKTCFELYTSNLSNVLNPTYICHGYVNEDGIAIVYFEDKKELSSIIFAGNVQKGEPIYHLLVTNDNTYYASIFVANPIECFGSDNRRVGMQLISPKGNRFLLCGQNFLPDEIISITSYRGSQKEIFTLSVMQNGTFRCILESKSLKIKKGKVLITWGNQNQICLKHYWGV